MVPFNIMQHPFQQQVRLANILPRANTLSRNELTTASALALAHLSWVAECQKFLLTAAKALTRNELRSLASLSLVHLSWVGQAGNKLLLLVTDALSRNECSLLTFLRIQI